MTENNTMLEDGRWVPAKEEPYHPTVLDSFYIFRKKFMTWVDRKFGTNLVLKMLQAKPYLDNLSTQKDLSKEKTENE